jgi:hypothetical protein
LSEMPLICDVSSSTRLTSDLISGAERLEYSSELSHSGPTILAGVMSAVAAILKYLHLELPTNGNFRSDLPREAKAIRVNELVESILLVVNDDPRRMVDGAKA